MIQVGTIVKVSDKTGVVLGQCIKVLGPTRKRIAFIGDLVIVTVKRLNIDRFKRIKASRRKKFILGTLHRGLVVRSKEQFCRSPGLYYTFNENAVVLVNKKVVPISNRVYGPILRELCMKFPSLGCTSRFMI